jgi:hypothetical protein
MTPAPLAPPPPSPDPFPQALGASDEPADADSAAREARALHEVERILAPAKDVSWLSGRAENSALPF